MTGRCWSGVQLYVPVRLGREFWGGLVIYSKRARQFTLNDVLVVKRIADYLMLGLSHQRSTGLVWLPSLNQFATWT